MDKKKLMGKFTAEKKGVMVKLDEKIGEAKNLVGQAMDSKERAQALAALDSAFVWAGKALRVGDKPTK